MIKIKNNVNKSEHLTSIQVMPSTFKFFAKELKEAEGFDELMITKKALEKIDDRFTIISYPNAKDYKKKFLTGEYRPLRPYFNTKVPYSFWCQLFIAYKRSVLFSN